MPIHEPLLSFGLKEQVIARMIFVFAQHPNIERVILFGSRAKGNYQNGSDIDLAIEGDAVTLSELTSVAKQLDDLDLPYKIDLIRLESIDSLDLREHIHRVGVAFYVRGVT